MQKDISGATAFSLSIVNACLRIVAQAAPKFWALENPPGRLNKYIGEAAISYNYKDFGSSYSKTVLLWGKFNIFLPDYIGNIKSRFDSLTLNDFQQIPKEYNITGSRMRDKRAIARSITYPGFAQKFFEFNQ